jgi:negative regulator of sigma E activity
MSQVDQVDRLAKAASAAKAAEARGDDPEAAREWRRYRLIEDASRDPEDLLTEGIALSVTALTLIEPSP